MAGGEEQTSKLTLRDLGDEDFQLNMGESGIRAGGG